MEMFTGSSSYSIAELIDLSNTDEGIVISGDLEVIDEDTQS